ncbi:DMT family transporter [Rhodobacteraceae bacterium]|nr:DMT family transporter [Paracoccaceae bacterium]
MVLMLLGSIVISFGGLAIRNIETADNWQINFYRSIAFALAISIVLLFRYGKIEPQKLKGIGLEGILAAMLLASASISFLQAITNTTVAATTFTLSSIPFLTAIMAWLFLGERIGKSTILTMCIAAPGISLMFVQGFGSGTLYGNFMALLCAVGFSSYAIIIRRNRRLEMLPTLILSNLIIMLVALLFNWDNLSISRNDLLICFILGGLLSATVNTLFLIAAKHLFAAELTLFMLLEFTLGPIWVWIFINEVPTSWTLVGGSIVISAVFLKSVSELRKAKV